MLFAPRSFAKEFHFSNELTMLGARNVLVRIEREARAIFYLGLPHEYG